MPRIDKEVILDSLIKIRTCLVTAHRMIDLKVGPIANQELLHLDWCIQQMDETIEFIALNPIIEQLKPNP